MPGVESVESSDEDSENKPGNIDKNSTIISRGNSSNLLSKGATISKKGKKKGKKGNKRRAISRVPNMSIIQEDIDLENSLPTQRFEQIQSEQVEQFIKKNDVSFDKEGGSSNNDDSEFFNKSADMSANDFSFEETKVEETKEGTSSYSNVMVSSKGFSTMGDFSIIQKDINAVSNFELKQQNLKFYGPDLDQAF